jgi:hypothetical protein
VTALRPLSIGHDGLVTEPSGIGGAQCYEWVVRLNLLVEQARQIVAVEATSNPVPATVAWPESWTVETQNGSLPEPNPLPRRPILLSVAVEATSAKPIDPGT